jgi:hypothetical protein
MSSILTIVFNFKQSTLHCFAENDVQPAIDFKIIHLACVRFEFWDPCARQLLYESKQKVTCTLYFIIKL